VISELEKKLGIKFNNPDLLQQAITHRSYLNEHRDYKLDHNERLEFLGDAVLELVVTEYLYENYPNPEGELTNWRASLVNGEMLAKISRRLGVEEFLMMSRGEAKDKGKARQYLLANAFESITGAIYLDQEKKPVRNASPARSVASAMGWHSDAGGGYAAAKEFILKNVIVELSEIIEKKLYLDPKSRFQEAAQDKAGITPSYKVLEESGPDHDKKFIIGIYLGDELVAKGEGFSKQEAQRNAAIGGLKEKDWR